MLYSSLKKKLSSPGRELTVQGAAYQCSVWYNLAIQTALELLLFSKWAIPGHFFFIFVFSKQLTTNKWNFLPMTGFEPQTSGVGSNHSTNWVTTTDSPLSWFFFIPFNVVCVGTLWANHSLFDPTLQSPPPWSFLGPTLQNFLVGPTWLCWTYPDCVEPTWL